MGAQKAHDVDAAKPGQPAPAASLPPLPVISHELHTLVDGVQRCIAGARDALLGRADAPGPAATPAVLERLDEAAMALERLNLLARAVADGKPNIVEKCSIIEAVRYTALAGQALAIERGVRLRVECSPRLVLTPAGPIAAVVASALHNAIEATPAGGEVLLVVELATPARGKACVEIDVFDTGDGPPPSQCDRPFELGFTTKPGAAGVGLSLAKAIVDELGGEIALTPRDDGKPGAHLHVRYPAPASDAFTP